MTVLRGLFGFLVAQGYLLNNPFAAVAMPAPASPPLGSIRILTHAQWDWLAARLREAPDTAPSRRSARALRWLYATGLRISEVAGARCGQLARVDFTDERGALRTGWLLHVAGKGNRPRQVPVPPALVAELHQELDRNGLVPDVMASSHAALPILGRFDAIGVPASPVSASGLAKAIKRRLDHAASGLPEEDADCLRKASAHWLRHSHGAHALQGRAGRAAVPLQVIQNNLGHVSTATMSGYLAVGTGARLRAMAQFWGDDEIDHP